MKNDTFQHIVDKHTMKYNERYAEHGDSHLALGWPRESENHDRFRKMCYLIRWNQSHGRYTSLLDFGCGLGHLYEWMNENYIDPVYRNVVYSGLDVNLDFIEACRQKHPGLNFYHLDVLDNTALARLPDFDYIVCNGVFTEKLDTPWDEQWSYFTEIIKRLWEHTKHGLAFNVASACLDQQRDDVFDVPLDDMAEFIERELSGNFVFHHDYNPWEYTTYVYV